MRDNNKRAWENLPESPQTQGVTEVSEIGTDKSRPRLELPGNDSLEQEIRDLLSPFSEYGNHKWDKNEWFETNRGDEMIDALSALIRRRERETVEAFAEQVKTNNCKKMISGVSDEIWLSLDDLNGHIDAELAKWKEGEKE